MGEWETTFEIGNRDRVWQNLDCVDNWDLVQWKLDLYFVSPSGAPRIRLFFNKFHCQTPDQLQEYCNDFSWPTRLPKPLAIDKLHQKVKNFIETVQYLNQCR